MKSGQSSIEYILLTTAVLVVVISVVVKNGFFSRAIGKTLTAPSQMIGHSATQVQFESAP